MSKFVEGISGRVLANELKLSNKEESKAAFEGRIYTKVNNIKTTVGNLAAFEKTGKRLEEEIEEVNKRINIVSKDIICLENTLKEIGNSAHPGYLTTSPEETGVQIQQERIQAQLNEKVNIELLIIGSSMVKFIDAKKIEKRSPDNSQTVCIPGGTIPVIMKKLREMKRTHNIKKMIIHVGANHIPRDEPHEILEKLRNMYEEVKSLFPSTYIYHSAMIPRLHNGIVQPMNYINRETSAFCKSLGIKTIEHPQFGYREINFDLLRPDDGIHPNFKGTSTIARNIIAVYRNYQRLISQNPRNSVT